jgi:MYXO-CTERM domain-containing protein
VPTGVLLLALVAFTLPWVNLSCGERPPGRPRKEYFSVTQSGLQAVYGGTSFHLGSMSEEEARSLGPGQRTPDGAPLLIVYIALMALGLAAGFFVRCRRRRGAAMGVCSVAALVALAIQLRLGLPLVREFGARSGQPDPLYHLYVELHYTPWFWLTLGATAVTPFAVWLANGSGITLRYPVLFRWNQIRAPFKGRPGSNGPT